MQITTTSGFTCEIDPDVLNNALLMDARRLEERQQPGIFDRQSADSWQDIRAKLYDHLTNEAGRVPLEDVDRELTEILQALGTPAKTDCPCRHAGR